MRKVKLRLAMLPLLLVCVAAVAQPARAVKQVALNQEFDIRVGEKVLIEGTGLEVSFQRVAQDSRCPKEVTCVWAGNGEVILKLSLKRKPAAAMNLNTTLNPKQDSYRGYDVKLVKLDPYPEKDVRIGKGVYVATLIVTRK